jgi:hypothetical protein
LNLLSGLVEMKLFKEKTYTSTDNIKKNSNFVTHSIGGYVSKEMLSGFAKSAQHLRVLR